MVLQNLSMIFSSQTPGFVTKVSFRLGNSLDVGRRHKQPGPLLFAVLSAGQQKGQTFQTTKHSAAFQYFIQACINLILQIILVGLKRSDSATRKLVRSCHQNMGSFHIRAELSTCSKNQGQNIQFLTAELCMGTSQHHSLQEDSEVLKYVNHTASWSI